MNVVESMPGWMSADAGLGLLAQFGGSHDSFGPPPIFMFFFVAIFVIVIGVFIFTIGSGIKQWADNNAQPERLDDVQIVSKRTEVTGREDSTCTTCYVTFEMDGGERKELKVTGRDYGQFAEGDRGRLSHRGTRYLGFTRHRERIEPPVVESAVPKNLLCAYCGNAIPSGQIKCEGCGWTWKPAVVTH